MKIVLFVAFLMLSCQAKCTAQQDCCDSLYSDAIIRLYNSRHSNKDDTVYIVLNENTISNTSANIIKNKHNIVFDYPTPTLTVNQTVDMYILSNLYICRNSYKKVVFISCALTKREKINNLVVSGTVSFWYKKVKRRYKFFKKTIEGI